MARVAGHQPHQAEIMTIFATPAEMRGGSTNTTGKPVRTSGRRPASLRLRSVGETREHPLANPASL